LGVAGDAAIAVPSLDRSRKHKQIRSDYPSATKHQVTDLGESGRILAILNIGSSLKLILR
jgi:hypothetical protein